MASQNLTVTRDREEKNAEKITHEPANNRNQAHVETGHDGGRLSFFHKVLLNALMTGNDSAVSFAQLYEIPLLQTFGVPTALLSSASLVAGLSAVLLIPWVGYVTDKGAHHRVKKMVAVCVNNLVLVSGFVLIIVASAMLMHDASLDKKSTFLNDSAWTQNQTASTPESSVDVLSLPTTAVLGMLGFILFDLGYDLNVSATRSCVLSCTPRQDHTSLLAQALGMAALGGCITCVLGLIDLAPLLNADSGFLPAQTTVQLIICIALVIFGTASTVVTSFCTAKRLENTPYLPLAEEKLETSATYGTFTTEPEKESLGSRNSYRETVTKTQELVECGNISGSETTEKARTVRDVHLLEDGVTQQTTSFAEANEREQHGKNHDRQVANGHTTFGSTSKLAPLPSASLIAGEQENTQKETDISLKSKRRCSISKETLDFVLICFSLYLTASTFFSYNMYLSDFVGKQLFGGSPSAPEGSAKLAAYEEGVSLASSGLLIFFCSYFVVSMLQDRMIQRLGLKAAFCLSHFMMASAVLALTLSKELACYFLACALFGLQRSAMLTIPFVLGNQYSQEKSSAGGTVNVGKVMALLSCMLPLNYCTIYFLSGPLIALTGYEGVPLLVAAGCVYLAVFIFMLHGVF